MTMQIEKPVRTAPPSFLNASSPLDILMIGAGGNGSELFDGLVRLHHALITLGGKGLAVTVMDDDEVSPSNVVRQRFWPHEVGANKAIALVQRANLMMGTNWTALPERFNRNSRLGRFDLVITAVDNLDARREALARFEPDDRHQNNPWIVNGYRGHADTYWLDLGCDKDKGQVVFGRFGDNQISDEWPTALAHFPEMATREDDNRPSCSAAESLARQDLMINQSVSGAAINMLWKLLRESKLGFNGVMLDLATGYSQGIPFMPINSTKH
ncbi:MULTISPECIES: PRTRC system ThiF family protein [Marinobacter]|uniref:UBA/THIF-type NAD/FAD binding protein n=1 Tax=Marinobacter nauticus (strain ATCC 700491 / DSM 11845 / VT8) TaxID=351348 RepID=A1U845_MARN8|nr:MULTISPECIES: PRTRC system ThiF family protein [Marinobacter]ABM21164.1 UBA/THIF-type NAD/FAD binding protein [Marinobacter nauticus VT8]